MPASTTLSEKAISGLQPDSLWNYFLDISRIPRESGNEDGVRQYLIDFAKDHEFSYHVDNVGNVIIQTPATKGMEGIPSLALQGHMDMVCVKDVGVEHDFAKDPITLLREGDWITAKGTTLGADNGIAIALILDLLSDPQAEHGPLEAIFTTSEETGLEGAFGLDASLIKSRKMLNLDSEEEGVFYIGCAGGVEVRGSVPFETTPVSGDDRAVSITVDNLRGGHSGGEIHKQRANAITSMARVLRNIADEMPIRLASIEGGTKRNVIPSSCTATITIPSNLEDKAKIIVKTIYEDLKNEFAQSDPDLRVTMETTTKAVVSAPSLETSITMINALFLAPHGVERMSQRIEGIVETSSNLAVIRTTENAFTLITSHRSSLMSSRDMVAKKAILAFETAGATCKLENPYPAWTPNPDLPLAKFCAQAWKEKMGNPAEVTAIHAGLECGIINSLVPGMDSVSLGPDLEDVHSTKERVSISSTAKIAQFLRHLCPTIS
jgi:dipeptidase D